MLWDACTMIGYSPVASDGEFGTVSDLLFDDTDWRPALVHPGQTTRPDRSRLSAHASAGHG